MLKSTIKIGLSENKIKINLNSSNDLIGYQEDINNFIDEQVGLSPNDVVDKEKIKFTYSGSSLGYYFGFQPLTYLGFTNSNVGFTTSEITTSPIEAIYRSFFQIQIFDSNNINKKKLLHTGYLQGKYLAGQSIVPDFDINSTNEFGDFYFPKYFIDTYTGQSLYAKYFFYNAKLSKTHSFYNFYKDLVSDEEIKLFFELKLDVENKTYGFVDGEINAREIYNQNYIDAINNNTLSFKENKPTYPSGQVFSGGTYVNIAST